MTAADAENPPTRRLHIGFVAPTRDQVDTFWRVGTEAGYRDDGPPGPRPQYSEGYYGAFLLDPDGNSVEAVHDSDLNRPGVIDHLWIRVADVARAKAFYETIAPHAGLRDRDRHARPGPVQPAPAARSRSWPGRRPSTSTWPSPPPTTPPSSSSTRSRPRPATPATGRPANAPRYHRGYYAAYVFDPDGNNIEVVNHHRDEPLS